MRLDGDFGTITVHRAGRVQTPAEEKKMYLLLAECITWSGIKNDGLSQSKSDEEVKAGIKAQAQVKNTPVK